MQQNETWAKQYARDSCKQNMERNVQQKRVPISQKTCRQTFDKRTLAKRKWNFLSIKSLKKWELRKTKLPKSCVQT